jgi:hypothetical protein
VSESKHSDLVFVSVDCAQATCTNAKSLCLARHKHKIRLFVSTNVSLRAPFFYYFDFSEKLPDFEHTVSTLRNSLSNFQKYFYAHTFSLDRYSSSAGRCAPALKSVRDYVPGYRRKVVMQSSYNLQAVQIQRKVINYSREFLVKGNPLQFSLSLYSEPVLSSC